MAAPDDSAYQDNPYGVTDPSALFQHLSEQNAKGPMGGMNQGLMVAGGNPAMEHARAVSSNMQKILAGVGEMKDDEDPIDYQMRQARAVSMGMSSVDPRVAVQADQQMLRLSNAKMQQAKLGADTEYVKAEAKRTNMQAAEAAADPMVVVRQGKDQFDLPSLTRVGNPVTMFDEQGNPRTGWSNDIQAEMKKAGGTPDLTFMKQSDLTKFMTSDGRNMATVLRAQQMAQQQLAQLSLIQGPEQQAALRSQAKDIVDRKAPMPPQPPIGARNMAAMQTWSTLKNMVDEAQEEKTPGQKYDMSDYGNNVKQENAWNHGPDGATPRRIGVAEAHLQDLETYARAIKQYGPDSPITNAITQKVQTWLGGTGPVSYDTANRRVAGEITSAVIGKTATLDDRRNAEDDTAAKLTLAQKSGSYDALHTMLYDQAAGLRREYLGGFNGMSDDEQARRWNAKLTPEGRAMMQKIDAAKGVTPTGEPISGNPATVQTTAEAKKAATSSDTIPGVHLDTATGIKYNVERSTKTGKITKVIGPVGQPPGGSATPDNPRGQAGRPPQPPLTAEDTMPAR